jgi:DNA polymerase III gamma/tau subunit
MYIKRLIEAKIKRCLRLFGGTSIQGLKGCGKTETSKIFAKSSFVLNNNPLLIKKIESNPEVVFVGECPHLIDE